MTKPAEDVPSEIDQLRRDIDRYRTEYLRQDDKKFRARTAVLIKKLEKRFRTMVGEDAP